MSAASSLDAPSPHLLLRGFLPVEEHQAILDWTLANQVSFAPSRVGSGKLRADFRSSVTAKATDYPWKAAFRQRVLGAAPELARGLGVAAFEVEQIQLSLIAYNDGDFYRAHVDTEPSRDRTDIDRIGDRVLSAVYYFHREPKAYSGGALRLHAFNPASDRIEDVAPEQNSLVAFASFARHEVRPVICPSRCFEDSRFAINCWVRRPPAAQ
jgi:Rps23 Pro-64 3,4-dihydroxylase Tpa1-like proline 4-hydroxylase